MNTLQKREAENKPSLLLSQDENERIFQLLGRKCNTLSTAIVQVVMTSSPHHHEWQKRHFGVACFVKDSLRRSYFIRVFDLVKQMLLWEQELYSQFTYHKLKPFLHCFEANDCMTGLSFASESEAEMFHKTVEKKLRQRQQKNQERRKNQGNNNALQPTQAGIALPSQSKKLNGIASHSETVISNKNANKKSKKRSNDKKFKLTKADIGDPTDFKHVQHVGFKSSTGFQVQQMENMDSELADFFKVAGISDQDLEDQETRDFIYEFIDQHGGIDKAKQEIPKLRGPPPIPARDMPPTPKLSTRGNAPPPPPARTTPLATPIASPNRHNHNTAPPPPPLPPVRVQMLQQMATSNTTPLPPPPAPFSSSAKGNAPPPPPPPPPPMFFHSNEELGLPSPPPPPPPPPMGIFGNNAPPPPPPPAPMMGGNHLGAGDANSAAADPRSAFLAQIRAGRTLNQLESLPAEAAKPAQPDTRDALLLQIRKGVELKMVTEAPRSQPTTPPLQNGLAGKLKQALFERSKAMQISESESEDGADEDHDDEWDD